MVGTPKDEAQQFDSAEAKGFDDFELRLGDIMRGERATMGKSLLDVQRELKIKAAYIAAIENTDPTAFDTPGFIAGYVRSYARYLGLDPDETFAMFCAESGFQTAHGMSAAASSTKVKSSEGTTGHRGNDIFANSATPFIPAADALISGIEPRALGSVAVMLLLLGGLGYGGYSVLQEVQKVQFAPVEQAPAIVTDIDPLAASTQDTVQTAGASDFAQPDMVALDRLYRPQALDVPVLVARDAPIATLRPDSIGTIIAAAEADGDAPAVDLATAAEDPQGPAVQVVEAPKPAVALVPVRPVWVRVSAADGTVLLEGTMSPGESFVVPQTETPPTLRVGESGAMYFAVNGVHHGPVGRRGTVTSNVELSTENLTQTYAVADLAADADLADLVNVAEVVPTE